MAIIPAQEPHRVKTRRRLTLDLFTRYGTFWKLIAELREAWEVTPVIAVPPEPGFSAEVVGVTRYQLPECFHMPDTNYDALPSETVEQLKNIAKEDDPEGMDDMLASMQQQHQVTRVGMFLLELKLIWRDAIPDDVRSGTNITGWMSWTPFLSACVLYDPPPNQLLTFADHDDHNAAELNQATYWQDAAIAQRATLEQAAFIKGRDIDAGIRWRELRRDSFIRSEPPAPYPSAKRGRPPDELQDVQCAILRRGGVTSADIGELFGWSIRDNDHDPAKRSFRFRSDAAEDAVRRGETILQQRAI